MGDMQVRLELEIARRSQARRQRPVRLHLRLFAADPPGGLLRHLRRTEAPAPGPARASLEEGLHLCRLRRLAGRRRGRGLRPFAPVRLDPWVGREQPCVTGRTPPPPSGSFPAFFCRARLRAHVGLILPAGLSVTELWTSVDRELILSSITTLCSSIRA